MSVLGPTFSGARLYIFEAGTVATPQDAFQDFGLTIEHTHPIVLDANGVVPAFYLADGFVKIRLLDEDGVQILEEDNLLVVGPSSGEGGGGGGVDATTVYQTGDLKQRYGTGAHSGWVRLNGRTIGSATSGATERANSDCEALFLYLYGADENLTVSGGRGDSAAEDWAANKTITLPDGRGRTLAALDDMGASAAGRLTSTYFGATATTLGAAGGSESNTLTEAKMPAHDHGGAATVGSLRVSAIASPTNGAIGGGGSGSNQAAMVAASNAASSITPTGSLTIASDGGGEAHANVQPTLLVTIYCKL